MSENEDYSIAGKEGRSDSINTSSTDAGSVFKQFKPLKIQPQTCTQYQKKLANKIK